VACLLLLPHSPSCGRRLPGQSQNPNFLLDIWGFFIINFFSGSYAYFESAFFEDWIFFFSSFPIKEW